MAILDVMMPGLNGFELTRALRQYSDLPILILSAKSQDNDKILGLNLGADDYIAKPFNPVEIAARVKAQLRRTARRSGNVLTVRDLALDTASFQLTKRGEPILLTPMEYKILAMLMRSPGRIFTKIQLYEGAIGTYFEGDDNTMMVHISKLADRRVEKVEDVVNIGDMIWVKVTDIDEKGRVNLSYKDALKEIKAKQAAGESVK